jgi:arsenate reductase
MKTRFTTYHNPRCGKSRATLTLLQGSGIEPHIAGVSEDASDRGGAHHHSVAKLGIPPEQLVRKGEEMYKSKYAEKGRRRIRSGSLRWFETRS